MSYTDIYKYNIVMNYIMYYVGGKFLNLYHGLRSLAVLCHKIFDILISAQVN